MVKKRKKKIMIVDKGYRYVTCKYCGTRQRFETYHDEWQNDVICDNCGRYLGVYD